MVQLQSLKCFSNLGNIFKPIFTFYFLENLVFWIDRCSDEKSLGIFVRCIWDKTSLFHVLVAFFGFLAAFKAWIGSLWRKLAEIYLKQSKMGLIRLSCCFQSYFCSFKGKTYPKTCLKWHMHMSWSHPNFKNWLCGLANKFSHTPKNFRIFYVAICGFLWVLYSMESHCSYRFVDKLTVKCSLQKGDFISTCLQRIFSISNSGRRLLRVTIFNHAPARVLRNPVNDVQSKKTGGFSVKHFIGFL